MRILVVDDDRVARLVAGATVTSLGHEAVLAASGEEAWAAYGEGGADVVLTDWIMPGVDGRELCRRIRAEPDGSYTYIAVVSSVSDRGDAMAAMEAGADDYIAKPLDPADLAVRLVVASRVTVLHRRLAHHRHELRRLHREEAVNARTDSLTGLGNRRSMDEELVRLAARDRRYGHHYWLMLCDLDRFKGYNDHYGHPAGDAVLAAVADALRNGLRDADSLFRYGGEEFLAVLTEASLESALETAERLRRQVEGLQILHQRNAPWGMVTMSVGLTALAGSVDMAVERADTALYVAKAGRNRVAWRLETDLVSIPAAADPGAGDGEDAVRQEATG
ncbi:MAG TPA: diguanylate cyclase [Acidimicrobiia bacterium]|nr:diguanylate cyclase [Acidimicrobiia bacterium]